MKRILQICRCSLFLLLPGDLAAQNAEPRYDLPPAVTPASCGLSLAELNRITGPLAYQRLAYQLKALQSAQEAVSALQVGREGLLKARSPAVGMSALFTGTKQAHDALLCSASIMAKYAPLETESDMRTLFIVAYNQEAAAIADLEAHSKEQFLRAAAENTPATQVKDAERMTAIGSLQSEAASTLVELTTLSLMLAVDDSNPNAKDTKQTVIPCALYPALLKDTSMLVRQTKSAYTDSASLFVKFLEGHKCK